MSNDSRSTTHMPVSRRLTRVTDAVWRLLCEGMNEPWLDEIRALRTERDGFEATLDIWSVALTAELKHPMRRETASVVLARLQMFCDESASTQAEHG